MSRGSAIIAAEVHFLEPPTSDHQTARFEVRMPSAPSYVFTYTAKLAKEMPIHPAPIMGDDGPIPVPNGAE